MVGAPHHIAATTVCCCSSSLVSRSVLAGNLGRSEVASNSIPHETVLHGGSSSCSSPFQYRQIQATELLGKKNPREDYSTLFGGERWRWGFAGAWKETDGEERVLLFYPMRDPQF
jgi:hypothetical protein